MYLTVAISEGKNMISRPLNLRVTKLFFRNLWLDTYR